MDSAVKDFLIECLNNDCLVIPVYRYSGYDAYGNLIDANKIGVGYSAVRFDECHVVSPENYFCIEVGFTGNVFETPQEALKDFINRKKDI